MNKKGFIFTFISVILISVLVLAFLIQYTSRTGTNIEKTNTEVETMNSFVKSLNKDYLPRALQVSGNQAILALLDYMDKNRNSEFLNGGYLKPDDAESRIDYVMYNGRFDYNSPEGPQMELMEIDNVSYNLTSTLNEVVNLANYTGINFVIEDVGASDIFQDNPWYINISIPMSYRIINKKNDISWSYQNIKINTSIPLINFRDPIYMLHDPSNNITVNKTIYDLPSQIGQHVLNANYVQCGLSPNFLNRMEGDSSASGDSGIESLVNLKYQGQSAIDYQYLLGKSPTGGLTQIPEASGYYIDLDHSGCYNF